jgi:VWFA-related protein
MLRRNFLFSPVLLAQDPPPIRVSVNLVNVPFSVVDGRGQLVNGLGAQDFEVFEDGVPQAIQFFSRAEDSPLTIAIVADVSGSQDDFLSDHRRDLRNFLKAVLKPQDQAMLICFGANVWLAAAPEERALNLHDKLKDFQKGHRAGMKKLNPPAYRDGASSVYDGIYEGARALGSLSGRRAIVVLTDGEDTSSAHTQIEAIEACQEYAVTLFALRYSEKRKGEWTARNLYGRSTLARIGLETGGFDYDASDEDRLREAYRQIAEILRSSYDLAYTSSQAERDGSFRKIKIRTKREGLRVRHKTGYYARVS